jgi:hypothetical protein
MRPGSLPLSQLVLLDLVMPPVTAFAWRLMAGRWAGAVQSGKPSDETQQRQKMEFWAILIMTFLMGVGFTIYAWMG